ncbi:uncharacterized protein LOC132726308 [Ruditapes philippinarum]|uniref:uncharacterized protein LOC132726308 n=1 Tax=Ruditapes philippinarum TaxID=129788 RepID=UPI00295A5BA3|nr:uncharacterized protein LOC132726308 [Ruditapes philippinarum]
MCDFIADCNDASDENCNFPQCSEKEFRCTNGQCIPLLNRCDSYKHCVDGTDESNCDTCKQGAFHCDLVRCIPNQLVCDHFSDCFDILDEENCNRPIRSSCKEWWEAGFRNTRLYCLDDNVGRHIDAECDFSLVPERGSLNTIIHSFEITYTGTNQEEIYLKGGQFSNNVPSHGVLTDPNNICTQNITQMCRPVLEAIKDVNKTADITTNCECITLTVYPYQSRKIARFCNDEENTTHRDAEHRLSFVYSENENEQRMLTYKYKGGTFPRDIEIRLSPIVCYYNGTITETTIGCEDEEKVFPLSVRCVFDIDDAGLMIGCRSGSHLQDCDDFECPAKTVKCPRSFCLPLRFICDGVKHCPDGDDENDCGCRDSDREVIILSERTLIDNPVEQLKSFAKLFDSHDSIVRHLQFQTRTHDALLPFAHRLLDISDEVVKKHESVSRNIVCKYSILASDFINSIRFTKTGTKGVIFIQNSKESEIVANMIFGRIKSRPHFHLFRVVSGTSEVPRRQQFDFVTDVVIKRWNILTSIGTRFFPQICNDSTTVYCPGEYQCAASKQCILLEQVCDGHRHCVHGDDERLCQYSCLNICTCMEYTTNCSGKGLSLSDLSKIDVNSRLLDLNQNPGLQEALVYPRFTFSFLIYLYMSKCNIHAMKSYAFLHSLPNLRVLDLSHNRLQFLPEFGFSGLQRLTSLNLIGNVDLYRIEPFALHGLQSLKVFELVGANIQLISSNAFSGLRLDVLNLTSNKIKHIEDNIFNDLYAQNIYLTHTVIEDFNEGLFRGVYDLSELTTSEYKYCCIRPDYLLDENCFPKKDELSSCGDLLRLSALQTMVWLIGLCALFGNILSVIYRLVYHRDRLQLGYEIFVTNLAMADTIMGIYLLIIAVADAMLRNRYIFMDDYWRNSGWCTVAGFLSTVASEASVFFLCLITLDRFLVIKYPFGQFRLNSKHISVLSFIAWTLSVIIALVPVVFDNYFDWKFYSKSGVCIALPLTRDRPPGWLYSVLIFLGLNFMTFCIIALGQGLIYIEIWKASSEIKSSTSRSLKSCQKRDMRVARNLLLVVTSDFLCWFPIGCIGFMAMSGYEISSDVYAWIIVFIFPVNSALNPVLYTWSLSNSKSSRKNTTLTPPTIETSLKRKVGKQSGSLPDLFWYLLNTEDKEGQTFISLNEVINKKQNLDTLTVLKISMELAHCLHILNTEGLTLEFLDKEELFLWMLDNQITGDIHLRKKPITRKGNLKDDIEKLGNVILSLIILNSQSNYQECNG